MADIEYPFAHFVRKFGSKFWAESSPWARDNIFWGMAMLLGPPIAAYYHANDTVIDWAMVRTALLLYAISLVLYVAIHYIRTAWKLDAENLATIAAKDEQIAQLVGALNNESPQFVLEIGGMIGHYNPNTNSTCVGVAASLVNFGADSFANGWWGEYASNSLVTKQWSKTLLSDEYHWPAQEGYVLVTSRADLLAVKASNAVSRGHSVHGRLIFEFHGNLVSEIASGVVSISIGCSDYKGKPADATAKAHFPEGLLTWAEERVRPIHPPSEFILPSE